MAKLTRKAATILALQRLGYSETERSNKYRTFDDPNRVATYLVGKSGALRTCLCGSPISKSRSLTGTRQHTAIEYVGRCAARQPNLPVDTLRRLYVKVMNREIFPANEFEEMK